MKFNCPECKLEITNKSYIHIKCDLKFVYNENNGTLIISFNSFRRKYLNIKKSEVENIINSFYQNFLFE